MNHLPASRTALIVIDVQESFLHRPYFVPDDVPSFLASLQRLVDGAAEQAIPVVQIFHVEPEGAFSKAAGWVKTMNGLTISPDTIFEKHQHSAFVGTGLQEWLASRNISRVIISGIRSEQCCETTARHASDLGYSVDYVPDATLTFPMTDRHGQTWSPAQIKDRTVLVLDERFARIATIEQALTATD